MVTNSTKAVAIFLSSEDEPWRTWEEHQKVAILAQIDRLSVDDFSLEALWLRGENKKLSLLQRVITSYAKLCRLAVQIAPVTAKLVSFVSPFGCGLVKQAQLDGESVLLSQEGNSVLRSTSPENYSFMVTKTLAALRHVLLDPDIDYVLRTNNSSLFEINRLMRWLKSAPKTSLYAGVIGDFGGIKYVSGAGILMSRDVCELLVRSWETVRLDLVDDVAIGEKLSAIGITPLSLGRSDWPNIDVSDDSIFHFRCKAGPSTPAAILETSDKILAAN